MAVMGCPRSTLSFKAWACCSSAPGLAVGLGLAPSGRAGVSWHSLRACQLFGSSIHLLFTMSSCRCSTPSAQPRGHMKPNVLTLLLQLAGVLHLGLVCAGLMMPRVVNLPAHLAGLPAFIRRLFWVYYAFIGLCLMSFGCLTFTLAPTLAGGTVLARALCAFFAAFWTLRLIAATFIFDLSPYLTNVYRRAGY